MSETLSEGMTFDQAAAEISDAVKSDPEFTPGLPAEPVETPAPAVPDQPDAPTPGEETPAPESDFASPDVDDSFMGGDFNPDLLPDELKPGFKQLQGAFTRKTQELAEQRKAYEELGDPDDLRTAREFYESLQNPDYLRDFYTELGGVVREMGLVEDDQPVAPEAPVEQPAPELPAELQSLVQSDPELQPFVDRFAAMEQRLNSFEQAHQEREAALQEEQALMVQAAEIDRQVQAVRESHPEYDEADWKAIYDRAIALDGNVLQSAELFQADRDRIIQGYLQQKTAAPAPAPLPGAEAVTESTEDQGPRSIDDANKAAQAFLDAHDMSEFTG